MGLRSSAQLLEFVCRSLGLEIPDEHTHACVERGGSFGQRAPSSFTSVLYLSASASIEGNPISRSSLVDGLRITDLSRCHFAFLVPTPH